ncbi:MULTISPECIES: IncL/M-type plasmid replication leader peptide RepB [Gammaproteobacteria]|uniref:Replication protein RepB n=5 Tax=Enterobacteriaceae TaxID=543 RepID=F1CNH6_ECOLX|nr:RepB [Citrobacter freundii]ACJ65249.1 RepB [Klebsiella pneumoniae]ADY00032.1 replication protein RepB [Escherichia coli]AFQ93562.1 RepB [Enterobacter cloacae]AVE25806.1 RepB [Klebsiella aerogenes]QKY82505.1 RepB [Salmonella enterica subsp. enterica serovar Havana]
MRTLLQYSPANKCRGW